MEEGIGGQELGFLPEVGLRKIGDQFLEGGGGEISAPLVKVSLAQEEAGLGR